MNLISQNPDLISSTSNDGISNIHKLLCILAYLQHLGTVYSVVNVVE